MKHIKHQEQTFHLKVGVPIFIQGRTRLSKDTQKAVIGKTDVAEDDIGLFNLFWNKTTLFKERVALKIGFTTLTIQVQDA